MSQELDEHPRLLWRGAFVEDMTHEQLVSLIRDELFPIILEAAKRQVEWTSRMQALREKNEKPAVWSPH